KTNCDDQEATNLGVSLSKCNNLKVLYLELCQNNIRAQGVSSIAKGITNCKYLTNLSIRLYINKIGDDGATHLGLGLSNCTELKLLNLFLEENQITDQGAQIISKFLNKLQNFQYLDIQLCENNVGDRIEQKYSHIKMHSEYILNRIFYKLFILYFCVYQEEHIYLFFFFFIIKEKHILLNLRRMSVYQYRSLVRRILTNTVFFLICIHFISQDKIYFTIKLIRLYDQIDWLVGWLIDQFDWFDWLDWIINRD
ncbi:transmembrane protein, putative, partial (macronuclear) [Tetrahymena thermophila SB210]